MSRQTLHCAELPALSLAQSPGRQMPCWILIQPDGIGLLMQIVHLKVVVSIKYLLLS
jgi:hypothetical protein